MSPNNLIYEKDIGSVFLTGDQGEFEILAYHYPLLGVLKQSRVVLDWKEEVPIKSGIVRFFANECIILVEEDFEKTEVKK